MQDERDRKRTLLLVGGVLLAAALVRLVASTIVVPAWERGGARAPFPDLYPTLAASLVDAHTLGYAPHGAAITTGRGPAFPAWLALPMLAGIRGDRAIAWWATVPGLLGGALAAWACLRLGLPPWLVATAAGLAALHPLPVFTSSRGMSDELCGVLGLSGVVTFFLRRDALGTWVSGLALGLALLTRATSVLFLAAVAASALIAGAPFRRVLAVSALALLPALAWSARSSALEGRLVFVHSLGAYNFWLGEAQDRFGFASHGKARAAAHALMVAEGGLPREQGRTLWHAALTPAETATLETTLGEAALARVRSHPVGYARRAIRGLGWFWIRADTWTTTWQYALVALPFLALALVGSFASGSALREPLLLALVLSVGLHAVVYAAVCPMARYSVVVYPCCAPLAAMGLRRILR
jgi:hypothetical protein